MTSATMIRWWLCAVLCSRSIASVAISSAVAKPKVASVQATSLSIVLGSVRTLRPARPRRRAFLAVPPPPRQTRPSRRSLSADLDDRPGHVPDLAVYEHAVRLVAAGAEDRAADGEDPGERPLLEADLAVLRQPAEAVPEADHLHAVGADRRLPEGADRRVQAGAVAPGREDADASRGSHAPDDTARPEARSAARVHWLASHSVRSGRWNASCCSTATGSSTAGTSRSSTSP